METNLPSLNLNMQVQEKPDQTSAVDDLKDAINEIQMAQANKKNLQNARDLINEL